MSILYPVSLAARRAFCPSLPMARESWSSGTTTRQLLPSSRVHDGTLTPTDRVPSREIAEPRHLTFAGPKGCCYGSNEKDYTVMQNIDGLHQLAGSKRVYELREIL